MKLQQQAAILRSADLAETAIGVHRPGDALAHARCALRADPGALRARLLEAQAHLQLQRPHLALAALDALCHYDPAATARPDVMALRIEALAAAGHDESALAQAARLIECCPQDALLHRLAADICHRLGRRDAQINHLRQITRLAPADAAAARTLARLLADENPQAAIAAADAGVAAREPNSDIAPIDASTLAARWEATRWMIAAGRDADAEENFRTLLAAATEDADLWLEAGDHADRMGSHQLASARYRQAIGLDHARQPVAMARLARTLMHAGSFAQAAWWWRRVLRRGDADARGAANHDDAACRHEALASLAVCGLCVDRPRLSELARKRLAAADGATRRKALGRAWLHAASGQVIARAREARPPAATASALTWMLQRAAEVLRMQSEKKPGWADTLYHTAVCRAALGDDDEARDCVQAALDINPDYRAATTLAARLPKAA